MKYVQRILPPFGWFLLSTISSFIPSDSALVKVQLQHVLMPLHSMYCNILESWAKSGQSIVFLPISVHSLIPCSPKHFSGPCISVSSLSMFLHSSPWLMLVLKYSFQEYSVQSLCLSRVIEWLRQIAKNTVWKSHPTYPAGFPQHSLRINPRTLQWASQCDIPGGSWDFFL